METSTVKKDNEQGSAPTPFGRARTHRNYYERRTRQWRNMVASALFAITIVFWAQLLFRSPHGAIQIISIRGLSAMSEADVHARVQNALLERRWGIVRASNIFFFDAEALRELLLRDNRIGSVRIEERRLRRQIILDIEERAPAYIFATPRTATVLDQHGNALMVLTPPAPARLTTVSTMTDRVVTLDAPLLSAEEWNFLQAMEALRKEKNLGQFVIALADQSPDSATATMGEGWSVYVSLEDPLDPQIDRLRFLLSERLTPARLKTISYIDLRFGERVFYK